MHARIAMLLAALFAAAAALAQSLMCPAPPAGQPCQAFHYHVQMYQPDTRAYAEFYGGPRFATEAACNRAREQQVAVNRRVVEFMRANRDQKYEPDRIGGCHCDMTGDRASVTYLADAQRAAQLRMAEEIRLRVRERLLEKKAGTDSEVVRGLWLDPPSTPALSMPKLVALPPSPPAAIVTAADELEPTRTIDTAKPSFAALDLPLVDIGAPPPAVAATAPAPAPAAPEAPAQPVVEEVVVPVEESVEAQPEPRPDEPAPAEEIAADPQPEDTPEAAAERFISYETERIQNVLRASAAIADEDLKTRIFEACMERIQLLSNLRLLIEGSGPDGALATGAREAITEAQRLAFVSRLFSDRVRPHWAPKDAADVVFEIEPAVASAPEAALRDATGRFTGDQKKRALYLVLARTQPDEEQRLWLAGVAEGFLR